MPAASIGFAIGETHGGLLRPANKIQASSDGRGWPSLYASLQREMPFEDSFDAVDVPLIVLHLDGPVTVHCRTVLSDFEPARRGILGFGASRSSGCQNTEHDGCSAHVLKAACSSGNVLAHAGSGAEEVPEFVMTAAISSC